MQWLRKIGAYVAVLLVGLSAVVLDPSAPQAAAFVACPPGAPPMSSMCSLGGAGVLAEFAAMEGGVASTATAVSTVAPSAVSGLTLGSALGGSTGLALSVGGLYGANVYVDDPAALRTLGGSTGAAPGFNPGPAGELVASHYGGDGAFSGQLRFPGQSRDWQVFIYELANGSWSLVGNDKAGISVNWSQQTISGQIYSTGAFSATKQWATNPINTSRARRIIIGVWAGGNYNTNFVVYSPGAPGFPVNAVTSVVGEIVSNVTCKGVSGFVTSVVGRTLQTLAAGVGITLPDVSCPAGTVATGVDVGFAPAGGGVVVPFLQPTGAPAPQAPGWVQTLPEEHPNCIPGAGTNCFLELFQISPGGQITSCGPAGQYCLDWYTHPQREEIYQCRYGGKVIALERCSPFREPGKILPNADEGTGGEPAPGPIPYGQPSPTPGVKPVPNPQGEPVPGEDPYNPPRPQPQPGTPPAPGTGTAPVPGAEQTPSECWPSGWGAFNPLAWVYMPVTCALQWAFVPSASALNTDALGEAVGDSAIGQLGGALGTVGESFGSLGTGACGVIADTAPTAFQGGRVVVDTCGFPWSSMGPLRTALGVAFQCGAVIIGIRAVLRTIRVEVGGSSPSDDK